MKHFPETLLTLFRKTDETHRKNLRSKNSYYLPKITSTNYGLNSLKYQGPKSWNDFISVNSNFRQYKSLPLFKKSLKNHFLKIYECNQ